MVDAVGDEYHRQLLAANSSSRSLLSLSRVISSSAANGSSISRIFGASPRRARSTPASSCRRTIGGGGVGEAASPDLLQRLVDALLAARLPRPSRSGAGAHCPRQCAMAAASAPGTRSPANAPAYPPRHRSTAASRSGLRLGVSPAITLSRVDFPHPDGPSKLTNSPGDDGEVDARNRGHAVANTLERLLSRSSGPTGGPDVSLRELRHRLDRDNCRHQPFPACSTELRVLPDCDIEGRSDLTPQRQYGRGGLSAGVAGREHLGLAVVLEQLHQPPAHDHAGPVGNHVRLDPRAMSIGVSGSVDSMMSLSSSGDLEVPVDQLLRRAVRFGVVAIEPSARPGCCRRRSASPN